MGAVLIVIGVLSLLVSPSVTSCTFVSASPAPDLVVALSVAQTISAVVIVAGLLVLLLGISYAPGLRDGQLLSPMLAAARGPVGHLRTVRRRARVLQVVGGAFALVGLVIFLVSDPLLTISLLQILEVRADLALVLLSPIKIGAALLSIAGLAVLTLGLAYARGVGDAIQSTQRGGG